MKDQARREIYNIINFENRCILGWSFGFSNGASGEEPSCQCRRHKRHGFYPWVRKIPWRRTQGPMDSHWRRKWQSTPVFLPGEFYGQRSLTGYSPWGYKESDMTEATEHAVGEFLIMIPGILRSHTSICNLISCIIFM